MIWLKYWQPILAAILTGFIAFGFHSCSVSKLEKVKYDAVEAQRNASEAQCIGQQQITIGASNVYQNGLTQRDNDLDSVLRQPAVIAISNESRTPVRRNATDKPKEPNYRNEINTDELYRFAGECEKDRLKVISLQQFIRDERK